MKSMFTFNFTRNLIIFFFTIIVIKSIQSLNNKSQSKNSDFILPTDACSCALTFPPCCSQELSSYFCPCAPRPVCGTCPSSDNAFVNLHDNRLKIAMKDAYNQQDLAQKAKLQVELFQKAQEFAKEVGIQEMKAKQYANILNEKTKKAQFFRAMMMRATNQVEVLVDQTMRAIQPIKCPGNNCNNNQMIVENLSPPNSMMNQLGFDSFMFKQREVNPYDISYNLRRTSNK